MKTGDQVENSSLEYMSIPLAMANVSTNSSSLVNNNSAMSTSTSQSWFSSRIFPNYSARHRHHRSSESSTSSANTFTSTPTPRRTYSTHQMNPGLSYFDSIYFIVVTMSTVSFSFTRLKQQFGLYQFGPNWQNNVLLIVLLL